MITLSAAPSRTALKAGAAVVRRRECHACHGSVGCTSLAKPLGSDHAALPLFEILHCSLVGFRGFPGTERTEVATTTGFGILLAGIKPVLPGWKSSNH